MKKTYRPSFEVLENRTLMATNIWIAPVVGGNRPGQPGSWHDPAN